MNSNNSPPGFDLSKPLSKEQAEAIYDKGKEAVIFALMALSVGMGDHDDQGSPAPHTPPGMIPPYEKPSKKKRRKKPGAKIGHQGKRRKSPEVNRHEEHDPLKNCPDCGSPLGEPTERRSRIIEDIVETEPEVTEHNIPRHWCPKCKKLVEPAVPDALPGMTFGHRIIALSAWLHYGMGETISHIISVLGHHLHFNLSRGGLVAAWQRLAEILYLWYEQIAQEVKHSGVLHADETGWRVDGKTHWLW